MSERVYQVGDLALRCSNEQSSRNRCVTVFDVSVEDGDRVVDKDLTGVFVTSYYLSTLVKHGMSAESSDDFIVHGGQHKVSAHEWPELWVWLREMAK